MHYYAILGNFPELSALELERLGITTEWHSGHIARLAEPIDIDRLGGTIKIAEYCITLKRDLSDLRSLQDIIQAIAESGDKLHFGFSIYAGSEDITEQVISHYSKKFRTYGIDWKKQMRQAGHSSRYVESKEPALSSVIVRKEKLLDQKTDFCIIIEKNTIQVGRTITVQDYASFSERDYGRPQRDHESGMLPPKVARMMVNIANPDINDVIVDPFCGSGTVLQEALLIGCKNIVGSDISKKAIEDTEKNLQWLFANDLVPNQKRNETKLFVRDVKNIRNILQPNSVDCIVGEGYLGPVRPNKTDKIYRQMTKLYSEALPILDSVLKPGGRIVLAIPAWKRFTGIESLPLDTILNNTDLQSFHEPIIYGREHARVIRQIIFLKKPV